MLVFVVLSILYFSGKLNSVANGASIEVITVDDLSLIDAGGHRVKQVQVGNQV